MKKTSSLTSRFYLNCTIVVFLLIIDVVINGTIDMIDHVKHSVAVYVFFGIQLVLRIVLLFMCIVCLWNSVYLQFGLIRALFSRFKLLCIFSPLSLAFLLGLRGLKISATVSGSSWNNLWSDSLYHGLFILNTFFSVGMYVTYLHMLTLLSCPEMYTHMLPGTNKLTSKS